ncbi:orotidine 5'-phosphate decarboxylase [Podochytrium sp. JEL0797]|nr:orotidine 5'-phosphate decarboxylase [Podochytrium sp. JEL0797]
MSHLLSYAQRGAKHPNATAQKLFALMESKQTNLCASVDVTTEAELLRIANSLGPYIDRKFADIGNTVKLQYSSGVHRIADWSHITNAHIVPGEGIIKDLAEVGLPKGRCLLLLAEMSSKGSMATGEYTLEALRMARRNREFCVGFIGQRRLEALIPSEDGVEDDFIYMTPGVGLVSKSDALGQQYRTPREVVLECGCDVIIVGRGIYGSGEVVENAKVYQKAGWDAYLERIGCK